MPTLVHEYDWPDRVVVGTVGPPGSRTFYLQVRDGARVTSVAMEKQWSASLAEKIDELLDGLMTDGDNRFNVPARAAVELIDTDPLDQPVEEDFRLGQMRLSFDATTAQVVVEAYPLVEAETEEEAAALADADPPEQLLLRMPVGTARAFAERVRRVVAAGRPACPLCGEPMDPEGHDCDSPGAR